MIEIEEKSRQLFMKYALPCAGTLVKRGSVTQKHIDSLIETVKNSAPIPKNSEKIFKVAFSACSLMALDSKKREIGEKIIREYYLFGHDDMINKRYKEMGDFDPQACRIRSGVVDSVEDGFAMVKNSSGTKRYRTDYCRVKKGNFVTTHWNFVVEVIDAATAEKMQAQKIKMKVV